MIQRLSPATAIASKTMVSRPITLNSTNAYNDTMNCCPKGRRLNYSVNNNAGAVNNNHKIDYYA